MSTRDAAITALLNKRRRKMDSSAATQPEEPVVSTSKEDDDKKRDTTTTTAAAAAAPTSEDGDKKSALEGKARQAILQDVERAKRRVQDVGPQGWLRPTSLSTNKVYLHRVISSTLTTTARRKDAEAAEIEHTRIREDK